MDDAGGYTGAVAEYSKQSRVWGDIVCRRILRVTTGYPRLRP